MYHARPALLTVFSITQLGHSITRLSIHDSMDLEKHLEGNSRNVYKRVNEYKTFEPHRLKRIEEASASILSQFQHLIQGTTLQVA